MKNRTLHPAASSVPIRPPVHYFSLGLWLRLGIASVWVGLAGLAMLLEAKIGPPALAGLTAVLGGATLATYAWQRVSALSALLDAPAADAPPAARHDTSASGTMRPSRPPETRWLALLQR